MGMFEGGEMMVGDEGTKKRERDRDMEENEDKDRNIQTDRQTDR